METSIKKMELWIDEKDIDHDVKMELVDLKDKYIKNQEKKYLEEINDRFYKDMAFGTGGLRGLIGAGTNRMNVHTVRRVTQAYSLFLLDKKDKPKVVIAYDNRHLSHRFAFESACVFAKNGIKVYVYENLTPTPMLSFAVRHMSADGGVVITASHNPKEYNGYKIYDSEGCQCLPDDAQKVSDHMSNVKIFSDIKSCAHDYKGNDAEIIKQAVKENELINYVPPEVDSNYYEQVLKEDFIGGWSKYVHLIYTSLNGTGNIPVRHVLAKANTKKVNVVEDQEFPDPDFTTCPQPNPEEKDALREGIKLFNKLKRQEKAPDILLATDPDCDRVGVMVNDGSELRLLDGNQVGILLFDYIINKRKQDNSMPNDPVLITTTVSTPMVDFIGDKEGIHVDRVLTGFKYIGDKIGSYTESGQQNRFIFGFEESCGYLSDTYVRDKDAVSATLAISEMTGYYKTKGKTLIDRIKELYDEYGYFISRQVSIKKDGQKGEQEIKSIMDNLRQDSSFDFFSVDIVEVKDYQLQTDRSLGLYEDAGEGCPMAIGTKPITDLPKENVVEYNFKDRSKIIVRPSGTEPKLKLYFSAKGKEKKEAEEAVDRLIEEFMNLIESNI